MNNQLAIQEQHDEDFKKLMTWQVLTQDHLEKLTARVDAIAVIVDRIAGKVDRQADMQAMLDERVTIL